MVTFKLKVLSSERIFISSNPAEEFSSGLLLKEKFLSPLIFQADQLTHLNNHSCKKWEKKQYFLPRKLAPTTSLYASQLTHMTNIQYI